MINCFNKHYRYLVFANTFYTYLTGDEQVDEHIKANYSGFDFDEAEGNDTRKTITVPQSMANKLS